MYCILRIRTGRARMDGRQTTRGQCAEALVESCYQEHSRTTRFGSLAPTLKGTGASSPDDVLRLARTVESCTNRLDEILNQERLTQECVRSSLGGFRGRLPIRCYQ
jgi:hypothetical protein